MTTILTNPVVDKPAVAMSRAATKRPSVGADTLLVAVASLGGIAIGVWVERQHGATLLVAIGVVAVWVSLAVAASSMVRRARLGRLADAIAGLNAIADGHLDPVSRAADRLGDDASAINEAADRVAARMRTDIMDFELNARRLNAGWNAVYEGARSMLQMSEDTVNDASLAASSADQVSQNMQHIAAATVEMATTVRNIAGHASDASTIANAGAQQVLQASGTMSELEEASQQVQDVVEVISSIASQTRVLALNATIEAGRAGDAGRGFVVVADSVKGLAKKTADATDQVTSTVRGIKSGSTSAVEVMRQITEMIRQVSDNQTAIASAVEQQTATTSEVGQSTAVVADSAVELARSVQSLTHALRVTAYVGAHAKSVAAQLTELEDNMNAISNRYVFERDEIAEEVIHDVYGSSGISVEGNTTTIQDFVMGTGVNEWDYQGRWEHGVGNVEADGSDSYCSMPDDTATLRFVGTRVRFYGVCAENHGMSEISVDDGPAIPIDEYAPHRIPGSMLFESPVLPRGEHKITLRVSGQTNPKSKYYWVTVDFAQIDN